MEKLKELEKRIEILEKQFQSLKKIVINNLYKAGLILKDEDMPKENS